MGKTKIKGTSFKKANKTKSINTKNMALKPVVNATLVKELDTIADMNGGGYFDSVYESAKSGTPSRELLKEMESNYEQSDQDYQDAISDSDSTSETRGITRDKDALDKQYDKIIKILKR